MAADLGAPAGKSFDRALGVLALWFADGGVDAQPVTHGGDFAKRHAALDHAERAGIHAEKDDLLGFVTKTAQVNFVWRPSVIERVVDM